MKSKTDLYLCWLLLLLVIICYSFDFDNSNYWLIKIKKSINHYVRK